MAKAICEKYLDIYNLKDKYKCDSAGLAAFDGLPANEKAITVMEEIGIDISAHISKRVSNEMIKQSSLVFVMNQADKSLLEESFPEKKNTFCVIGNSVSDPYGQDISAYQECRNILDGHIKNIVSLIVHAKSDKGYHE